MNVKKALITGALCGGVAGLAFVKANIPITGMPDREDMKLLAGVGGVGAVAGAIFSGLLNIAHSKGPGAVGAVLGGTVGTIAGTCLYGGLMILNQQHLSTGTVVSFLAGCVGIPAVIGSLFGACLCIEHKRSAEMEIREKQEKETALQVAIRQELETVLRERNSSNQVT